MTRLKRVRYSPKAAHRKLYDRLYAEYRRLHDGFGGRAPATDFSRTMKDLLAIKNP